MLDKINKLLSDLKEAVLRLDEAYERYDKPDLSRLEKDGTIQRFEFTFELSWKLMQAVLSDQHKQTYGVKTIIRESAKLGLIDSPTKWFGFLDARNLTAHTYKQETADEVLKKAKKFGIIVKKFVKEVEILYG